MLNTMFVSQVLQPNIFIRSTGKDLRIVFGHIAAYSSNSIRTQNSPAGQYVP